MYRRRYPIERMDIRGELNDKLWSYINKNQLTVRKLYNVNKWNIVYDLDNGNGF